MLQETIEQKLKSALSCTHLEIINESHLHKGHNNFDGTGESHFKIIISAPELKSIPKVQAHKTIYKILQEELNIIHALSIDLT